MKRYVLMASLVSCALVAASAVAAQGQSPDTSPESTQQTVSTGKVVARGTVASEAARAAIVQQLRKLYGADRVVDKLKVGGVYAPPQWQHNMTALLAPGLKQIDNGQLRVDGKNIRLSGSVTNEAQRQQVLSKAATALGADYTITNALKVSGQSVQAKLDALLDERTVTFESGSSRITADGRDLLDDIVAILNEADTVNLLIAGYTDNTGTRATNVRLSIERASAVKHYLVEHGIKASTLSVMGYGADRPIATNATPEGRAKNRRIEFIVR